jgi:dCTP deaminase
MAFWSDRDFIENIKIILPPEENDIDYDWIINQDSQRIQGSSLELALGNEVFISSKKNLQQLDSKERYIKIAPGDFALLITHEYIKILPSCMGFISIKFDFKHSGLVNISGFHVDPGFEGRLKFSVYNAGTQDVILKYGDPTFIVFITDRNDGDRNYSSKRQKQRHIEPKEMIPFLGAGIPLHNIAHRVDAIEKEIRIYVSVFGGLLISILILLLKWALK